MKPCIGFISDNYSYQADIWIRIDKNINEKRIKKRNNYDTRPTISG